MDKSLQSSYSATYTSFSGADIVATFNDSTGKAHVIGEMQAISYSVTREKAPVYTMGSPDPRSFSRGKRGIAGSLVFTVFNKDTLKSLKVSSQYTTNVANAEFRDNLTKYIEEGPGGEYFGTVDNWEAMQEENNSFVTKDAYYADEIPPFDVTITMVNEYGQSAKFSIIGVEILNEGSGMSIDDITTEKACTFVARAITPLTPGGAVTQQDMVNR